MPPAGQKSRKSSNSKAKSKDGEAVFAADKRQALTVAFAAAFFGAVLGLSAPGLEQWYLAWFAIIPLCLLVVSSPSWPQAFWRGFTFGTAYNLVYLNWYLGLHPLTWLGFSSVESIFMAVGIWIALAIHQGLIVGLFALLCRMLPLSGGFLPHRIDNKWYLPALIVIPLAWVLMENKIGNAHDLLGVPWSMVEYSQYKQLALIQIASVIGGIGVGFLILLVNVTLASLVATISRKYSWQSLAAPTLVQSLLQVMVVAVLITSVYAWGLSAQESLRVKPTVNLTILQGDINIDMQKADHHYTLNNLLTIYGGMLRSCPRGLCVWAENALPTYLNRHANVVSYLENMAKQRQLDMVVGSLDRDNSGKPYSSAFGFTHLGTLEPDVYHKRFLVPFGEYMPHLVEYLPECLRRLTCTAAGSGQGLEPGVRPVVWSLIAGRVAPIVCFEAISPEIVASSVRAGGTLLVNLTDLSWFHDAMIGQQMMAFAVLRAVESRRYYVFACNTGPSAIIDPAGKITASLDCGKQSLLIGKAGFSSEITPFSYWFR
jgi:apolipoprotein N-acyltransferase